ncbi:MAG: undecaprenyldiphospho-muramoylpentapeptide beta-N-acetylglucosaminyltransferase [Flavobacteriaceae bacterium]
MKPFKIIISGGGTGGHLYPALAIADEFKLRHANAELLFVGALGRIEMDKVPMMGYRIEGLWIDGLQRSLSLRNLIFPIKLIFSLLKSITILLKFRPNVVVGTGGFASGPLLFMAGLFRIPTLIQEQNSYPGITNRLLSKSVRTIAVAYEGLERYFPKHKLKLTGNPIRKSIADGKMNREKAKRFFDQTAHQPTLVVLGGSLGARRINQLIVDALDLFEKKGLQLIWQCGTLYYEQYKKHQSDSVKILPFVTDMDQLYAAADMIISRSGAATLSELCCVGCPALLIPSPNVAENHQYHNAKALADREAALLIQEKDLDREFETVFDRLIDSKKQKEMTQNLKKLAQPHATSRIVELIEALI